MVQKYKRISLLAALPTLAIIAVSFTSGQLQFEEENLSIISYERDQYYSLHHSKARCEEEFDGIYKVKDNAYTYIADEVNENNKDRSDTPCYRYNTGGPQAELMDADG